jgi:hypothetical protein
MMWRSMRWLLVLALAIGAFGLWASSQQTGDEALRARVEALEKRVRELEQRLARLERQQTRLFVVPRGPFIVPFEWEWRWHGPRERRTPEFGQPRPAPERFIQPYYYPLTPEP